MPESTPAELAALIEQLRTQLVAAEANLANEQQTRKNVEENLNKQLIEANMGLENLRKSSAAAVGEAAQKLKEQEALTDDMQTRAEKAEATRDAYAQKFENLYGPLEPGITLGPAPYVTGDGQTHSSLESARIHLLSLEAGLPIQQVKNLISKAATVMPLLQKFIGEK